MTRRFLIIALAIGTAPAGAACQNAANSYNLALDDISIYLRQYTGCLQTSKASNSCGVEFQKLRAAQDSFEIAVDQREKDCRR